MSDTEFFVQLRAIIQDDVGSRGLARLFAALPDDLENACRSLASVEQPRVLIVTGFFIPSAEKPETDGPLGAVLLGDAFGEAAAGDAAIATENWLAPVVRHWTVGNAAVHRFDPGEPAPELPMFDGLEPTHIIAIERPGPAWADGNLHTMRGIDITANHAAVHAWFEAPNRKYVTIAVGDGGNEIGMGKLPRALIEKEIQNGAAIACRTPADHLIVAGISNWGAYALAAGYWRVRGWFNERLFEEARHRLCCEKSVARGSLVDGLTGAASVSVDGQPWDVYIQRFRAIRDLLSRAQRLSLLARLRRLMPFSR